MSEGPSPERASSPPAKSELERLIKVKGLPAQPVIVEADEAERGALAARFTLTEISRLRGVVELEQRPGAIRATGTLTAAFLQPCAVSGEDFAVEVDEPIELRFIDADTRQPLGDEGADIENMAEQVIELEAADCDEIDYSGGVFDLGEAVAQTLGLAIDPYAEGPGAEEARAKAGITREGEGEGPLADMLRGLAKG